MVESNKPTSRLDQVGSRPRPLRAARGLSLRSFCATASGAPSKTAPPLQVPIIPRRWPDKARVLERAAWGKLWAEVDRLLNGAGAGKR
jgi:hypothetical protein